jgi:putative addiction module component (TIGR02574 family)
MGSRIERNCTKQRVVCYNAAMDVLDQLRSAALALSDSERATLAAELIDSLDPSFDLDHESVWSEEIARRIAALDSGQAKTIPWDEVRARMTGQ